MRRIAFVVAAAALAAGVAQAELSETEQRIVAAVKERNPAALGLLERSVRINSGTLNAEGVREVGKLFRAEFDALGFATRWVDMPPDMKRAGHLIATREGTQGKRLLLLGHMDTVFEKNSPVIAWDPRGARVRGQGVGDMKGGDVIMIEALRALQRVGALDGTTISVILTGDEEKNGDPVEVARAPMVELARKSDAALSFEGSVRRGDHFTASIARRSSGGWTIRVTAKSGHSSRVFTENLGYGAIYEAARILNAFREQLIEPNLTFNPGVIVGGTLASYDDSAAEGKAFGKTNVIAKELTIRGDLRALTAEQIERTKAKMREIVAKSLPQTQATIEFRDGYPPMPPTEAGQKLVDLYSKASVDAGFGPVEALDPNARGAGDVQFVAPYIPGIDGLGASGSGAHTDDEDLEIASIERGAIKAAILIYRMTR
jgi:glutamate carboxypeptidase